MADSKVSALTNLGAAPASGDILPIVDVSDTTQSANGTTKKVTKADLLTGYLTDITGESLGDLSDVSNASATSGQVLKYNGSAWAPGTDETASGAGAGDMLASTYDPATISEQLVGLTATQTLTNKTLTVPTITLKQSASAAPTAEGDIQWDTDDNKLKVGDGAGTKTFSDDTSNASTYAAALHNHDSSYYTEGEVDTLLAGKSATGHSHDDLYYTEGEVDTLLTGKSATGHTHVEADITDLGTYLTDITGEAVGDLSDVTITTPADNEVLAYNGSGAWINQTPAEAGLADATHTHTESDITDLGSYIANPMTTAGDLIYGGASGAPTRLGVGTDDQVLTLVSGAPAWADAAAGGGTPIALETTVATYAELISALGAGSLRIGITADLTATANLTVPDDAWLIGLGGQRTLTMGNYYFENTGTAERQRWENLLIIGTAGQIWYYQGGFDGMNMKNCKLDGGTTASRYDWFAGNTGVTQTWRGKFENCYFTQGSGGVRATVIDGWTIGSYMSVEFDGCSFDGWGITKALIYIYSGTYPRTIKFNNCHFKERSLTGNLFVMGTSGYTGNFYTTIIFDNSYYDNFSNTLFDFNGEFYRVLWIGGILKMNTGTSITDDDAGYGQVHFLGTRIEGDFNVFRNSNETGRVEVFMDGVSTDSSNTVNQCYSSGTFTETPILRVRNFMPLFSDRSQIEMMDNEILSTKNVSGGTLARGDAVVYTAGADSSRDRTAITTTTTAGDTLFEGIIADKTILNNYRGNIIKKGFVKYAKVDVTTEIAFGDTLGTHTVAGVLAKNTTAGERVGFALGAYTADDSNGTIPVFLWGTLK